MSKTVGDLKHAEYNPRKMSDQDRRALEQAMRAFGDLSGVVFNRKTGNLVGGHQRVTALEKSWPVVIVETLKEPDNVGTVAAGYIKTPFGNWSYREVDWELAVEKAANIAANRISGTWDDAKLKDVLVGLDTGAGLLELSGFSPVELQGIMDRAASGDLSGKPSEEDTLFHQMTFTVNTKQRELVRTALTRAVDAGAFESTGNEDEQGNALARIAVAYNKNQ